MHLGNVSEVTFDQRDANDTVSVVPDRPSLFRTCGLDVLGVGLRLPEPFGNCSKQTSQIIGHLLVELSDPTNATHATLSGVIEAICSPASSSARSSS